MVAEELGLPVVKVQHHYAHILSCMAENDCEEKVIGVSFDGTGYGTDGTIWGGEILIADYQGFTRLGSIQPFVQVGGDVSAKEGWRIAVSLIWQNTGDLAAGLITACFLPIPRKPSLPFSTTIYLNDHLLRLTEPVPL